MSWEDKDHAEEDSPRLRRHISDDAIKAIEEGKGDEIVKIDLSYKIDKSDFDDKIVLWVGFNDPEVIMAIMETLLKSDEAYVRGIGEGFVYLVKHIYQGDDFDVDG
jgi:hypothetical protein